MLAGTIQAGYFQPRDPRIYDPDLLERHIPIDVLKKCFIKEEKKTQLLGADQAQLAAPSAAAKTRRGEVG